MAPERLKEVLIQLGFSASEIQLENAGGGKVGGVVVAATFEGASQEERQEKLWEGLRQKLPPEELIQIVAIMTMTPKEIAA